MDGPLKRPLPPLRVFIARPWRETGCSDPDPMVRIGALDTLENAPANQIWPLVSPLLSDPIGGVRFISIVWLAAYANAAQERGDPKTIF